MTAGDRDELLSAYLDREVTPSERAEVEARLDASPDARAELDGLAELSLCLRTLDRPQAPADLKTTVMQTIAGRTMAPAAVVVPRRRFRREWTVSILATALTACGLFVAVTSWNSPQNSLVGTAAPEAAMATKTPGAIDSLAVRSERPEVVPESMMISEERKDRALRMRSGNDRAAFNFPAPSADGGLPAAPMSAAASPALGEALSQAGDQPALAKEWKENAGKGLDKVALNQFLEMWAATDATDRYVANIDLQVLDVRKSADTFQVLLHNNSVVTLQDRDSGVGTKSNAESSRDAGNALAEKPVMVRSDDSSMIAVYVDTSVDRVTKSLEELAERHDVLGVRLQQPLALARIAEDAVAPERERGEALQRAEVEVLANAYIEQQLENLSDFDLAEAEGPVDALLDVQNTIIAGREAPAAKSRAMVPAMKQQLANRALSTQPADVVRSKAPASPANALVVNNYATVVRLPVLNSLELVQNNTTFGTGEGKLSRWSDAKPDPLQYGNTQRRGTPSPNDPAASALGAGRQRNSYRDNSTNPVRVLVVFQDPPPELKAKAPSR